MSKVSCFDDNLQLAIGCHGSPDVPCTLSDVKLLILLERSQGLRHGKVVQINQRIRPASIRLAPGLPERLPGNARGGKCQGSGELQWTRRPRNRLAASPQRPRPKTARSIAGPSFFSSSHLTEVETGPSVLPTGSSNCQCWLRPGVNVLHRYSRQPRSASSFTTWRIASSSCSCWPPDVASAVCTTMQSVSQRHYQMLRLRASHDRAAGLQPEMSGGDRVALVVGPASRPNACQLPTSSQGNWASTITTSSARSKTA